MADVGCSAHGYHDQRFGNPPARGLTRGAGASPDRSWGLASSFHPMMDVVFVFSYVTWQAAARREWFASEDRLACTLLATDRVQRVLVCDVMRSLPVKLIRDRMNDDEAEFPASERAQLLQPVRLRRSNPTSLGGVERTCRAYDRALARAVQRMGLKDPVAIVANPLVAGFSELAWARAVTFYAIDDWSAYPPHERWWPAYRESFRRVAERGRRVAAVSAEVLERVAPSAPGCVVPNGLEPAEWLGQTRPPAWVEGSARPLLVYAGTLDSRLDVKAIAGIAGALPKATVTLIGPLVEPDWFALLRDIRNVEIRPPVGRADLAGLVRSADLGLIPHLSSDLTRAMSPLKLYEYLAAGLPVLASDLAPMRGVASARVRLVAEGGDFAAALPCALALGRAPEAERLAFLEENSWRARHEQLLDLALA